MLISIVEGMYTKKELQEYEKFNMDKVKEEI